MPVIINLAETSSTNTYLRDLAKEGLAEKGTIVFAEFQTQGRGQHSSTWLSDRAKNLTFSYYLPVNLKIELQFYISIWTALVIYNFLESYTLKALSIKWPNDIYIGSKKICGVLIETTLHKNCIKDAVIGIGLNVNQEAFPNLPNATSLKLETQKHYDLSQLLRRFQTKALETDFPDPKNLAPLRDIYEGLLYKKGIQHLFKTPNGIGFEGKLIGIDNVGRLQVDVGGVTMTFTVKEIVF